MPWSDEQVERMRNHEQYLQLSGRDAQAEPLKRVQALTLMPRYIMLAFFSISDQEAAYKGKSVPIELEPKIAPTPPQIEDNHSLGQYLKDADFDRSFKVGRLYRP